MVFDLLLQVGRIRRPGVAVTLGGLRHRHPSTTYLEDHVCTPRLIDFFATMPWFSLHVDIIFALGLTMTRGALTCAVNIMTMDCGVGAIKIDSRWQTPSYTMVLSSEAVNP